MRRFILPAALVALTFGLLPKAQAADPTGWFVNAGVGNNHFTVKDSGYSFSDNATGAMFNVGWRSGNLGFEVGYTDLGSFTQSVSGLGTLKLNAHGATAGINLRYNASDSVYISGRGGAFMWTAKETYNLVGLGSGSDSTSSTGWYAGVGAGFNFAQNWSVGGNYNYYSMSKSGTSVDNSLFSVSLEYSF